MDSAGKREETRESGKKLIGEMDPLTSYNTPSLKELTGSEQVSDVRRRHKATATRRVKQSSNQKDKRRKRLRCGLGKKMKQK